MSEVQQEAYQVDPQNAVDAQLAAAAEGNQANQHLTNKRKRDSIDDTPEVEEGRAGTEGSTSSRRTSFKQTSPNMSAFMPINPNSPQNAAATDAAHAALAANAISTLLPTLGAGMSFPSSDSKPSDQHVQLDPANFTNMSPQPVESHTEGVGGLHTSHQAPPAPVQRPAAPNPKPQVGTEEWHRVRRDNHKEVERRRRETINEGINELAKIVPGCEKNKGSILQRAVQYIQQLKENEAQNIEKWTLEKLLTEQAIQDLSQRNEKLQKECERAWREAETWKKTCLQAGVTRESGGQAGGSS